MNLRLLPVALLAIGCGTDKPSGPATLPDLHVPPKPTNGLQIVTQIFDGIQPAMDYEVCEWTDQYVEQDTDIKSEIGFQNEPPGHHALVFYTSSHRPPGTQKICEDSDMVTFRFLTGGGSGVQNDAPGNVVWRIPAGSQLVINHHYLNATDNVLKGQAVVNLTYAEAGNNIPSGNMAVLDTNIQVPVGQSTWNLHCPLDRTQKLWRIFPHMHRYGQHVSVDITQAGVKSTPFDLDWDPSFTFHPPDMMFDPAAPLTLNSGDAVDVHCTWNNTTPGTVAFGIEMCVAFGMTVDDSGQGSLACNAGDWGPF